MTAELVKCKVCGDYYDYRDECKTCEKVNKFYKHISSFGKSLIESNDEVVKQIQFALNGGINDMGKFMDEANKIEFGTNVAAIKTANLIGKNEDIINKPDHYHKGDIDIYEIMQAKLTPEEYRGFCKGNVLKYTLRADLKGDPIKDTQKLRFNVDRLLECYRGEKYIPEHKRPKAKSNDGPNR